MARVEERVEGIGEFPVSRGDEWEDTSGGSDDGSGYGVHRVERGNRWRRGSGAGRAKSR